MRRKSQINITVAMMHWTSAVVVIWIVGVWLVGAAGGTQDEGNIKNTRNIFLRFAQRTEDVLESVQQTKWPSRESKLLGLVRGLRSRSKESQARVWEWLDDHPQLYTFYSSMWITNELYIREATPELIPEIARLFREVRVIMDEIEYQLDEPVAVGEVTFGRDSREEWGVQLVQAREAMEFLSSHRNETTQRGLRVGTIDTGVRGSHEALRGNYFGTGGWFDPYGKGREGEPFDTEGHGTHTAGILVGSGGIGVLPEAKWLSCRGCEGRTCKTYELQRCGQFMACPGFDDHKDDSEWDCSNAPQIVSNSWNWNGVVGAPFYDGVIGAYHVAGIIPFFSAGNGGPSCSSVFSPADRDVIAVGSTTRSDHLSVFSSGGPGVDTVFKPDISAPGSDILSASHVADNAYQSRSGTSMASPCAAGVAGILLSYDPSLTYQQVLTALRNGADREVLKSSGGNCYGLRDDIFPNFLFGYGRVNALNSAKLVVAGIQKT